MFGNRFFIFLLLLASLSCDDDNETSALTFPSVYIKSGIEAVGKLRVFAVTGELKQNSIVSRYNQYDTSYFNGYANYISNDHTVMDTVYFLNGQSAVLNHESQDLDCLLSTENNSLILTETVVASRCCTYGEVMTRSLPYSMSKVKPEVLSEYVFSSVKGNYTFAFTGRRKYVFKESGELLAAPLILYTLHSKNFDGGFVNNFLQPDFYSILAEGDTVALMEYQIVYEK